jgi:hypothetical protein
MRGREEARMRGREENVFKKVHLSSAAGLFNKETLRAGVCNTSPNNSRKM